MTTLEAQFVEAGGLLQRRAVILGAMTNTATPLDEVTFWNLFDEMMDIQDKLDELGVEY